MFYCVVHHRIEFQLCVERNEMDRPGITQQQLFVD